MALPQLPAYVVHKLGQHSRVIQEFLSTREYAKESRPFRSALFRACGLSNIQGTFRRFLFKYFFSFNVRSLCSRGEEIPMFAPFVRVFKHVSSAQTILRSSFATSAFADAFLCLLLPNDIRVLFPEKALLLRLAISLFSLYLPLFYRPTSGRRPREQRHNSPPTKSAVC